MDKPTILNPTAVAVFCECGKHFEASPWYVGEDEGVVWCVASAGTGSMASSQIVGDDVSVPCPDCGRAVSVTVAAETLSPTRVETSPPSTPNETMVANRKPRRFVFACAAVIAFGLLWCCILFGQKLFAANSELMRAVDSAKEWLGTNPDKRNETVAVIEMRLTEALAKQFVGNREVAEGVLKQIRTINQAMRQHEQAKKIEQMVETRLADERLANTRANVQSRDRENDERLANTRANIQLRDRENMETRENIKILVEQQMQAERERVEQMARLELDNSEKQEAKKLGAQKQIDRRLAFGELSREWAWSELQIQEAIQLLDKHQGNRAILLVIEENYISGPMFDSEEELRSLIVDAEFAIAHQKFREYFKISRNSLRAQALLEYFKSSGDWMATSQKDRSDSLRFLDSLRVEHRNARAEWISEWDKFPADLIFLGADYEKTWNGFISNYEKLVRLNKASKQRH